MIKPILLMLASTPVFSAPITICSDKCEVYDDTQVYLDKDITGGIATLSACKDMTCIEYKTDFVLAQGTYFNRQDILNNLDNLIDARKAVVPTEREIHPFTRLPIWALGKEGSGSKGFLGYLSKWGSQAVNMGKRLITEAGIHKAEVYGGVKLNGTDIRGDYNGATGSWKVTVTAPGFKCECGPQ